MKSETGFPKSVQPGMPRLGVLPNGWVRAPLGDFLEEVKRPVRMKDETEYDLVTVKRSRGGVVRREHLLGKEIAVKNQFYIEAGDFLISKRQIVHGACGIVPKEMSGSIVSNEYSVLIIKKPIDIQFLNYLSASIYFQQTCFHSSIGVHIEKMIFKLDRWLKWPFNLPLFKEQKKIVQVLATWDKTIELTEKLLANSQQQKKALMQQLLNGKKRFPGFIDKWKKVKLGEISQMKSGGTPQSSVEEYYNGDIPWVSIADMTKNGKFISVTDRYITELGLKNSSAQLYPKNTVLFAMYASIGECSIADVEMSSSQAILGIRPGPELLYDYLYYYLFSLKDRVKLLGQQGTQSNLNAGMVKSFELKLPTLKEQQKIANIITVLDQKIENIQKKIDCLKLEKKALMQHLLTGKK